MGQKTPGNVRLLAPWVVGAVLVAACGGTTAGSGSTGLRDAGSSGGSGGAGSGGKTGTGGVTSTGGAKGTGGSIDCSLVGCAAPPMCSTGCTEPCGCCPCVDGQIMGSVVCKGGCYVALDGGAACDPAAELHQRSYVSTDPSQCKVIKYSCIMGTTPFSNACGCGCEQAATCPDWFNCMPGPGAPPCDVTAIQTQCPYSGIAY